VKLNPKTKLATELADTSALLVPEDLPQKPTPRYQAAMSAFRAVLEHLWSTYEIEDYGYNTDDSTWYCTIKAPSTLNTCELLDKNPACPYYVQGTVSADGATPAECVEKIIQKVNDATDWQRKVISLLNSEILKK
jgi:hypothetical protein